MPTSSQNRVAFLMLAYNQEALVRQSALACLAQECEPLDIVLSDDASTDRTFEVLQEVARRYEGPHRVTVRRNERNLGIGAHLNALIALCGAEFIIASAGDDISHMNRARELISAWDETGQKVDLISSHCTQMSFAGVLGDQIRTDRLDGMTPQQWLAHRPYIIGATHAFTRRLHTHFGDFGVDVVGEDQIMVFRALCLGGAITLDQSLVNYRDGGFYRRPDQIPPSEFFAWMQKLSKFNLAEAKQLIRDVRLANIGEAAERKCKVRLDRELFLKDLLQSMRLVDMLFVAFRHVDVPILWRYKKVFAFRFHAQYSSFQRMNRKRRLFVRKLAGR